MEKMMLRILLATVVGWIVVAGLPPAAARGVPCGTVVSIDTHARSTTRYALVPFEKGGVPGARIALVLLVGGGGHLDLDDQGCPRALTGNALVRFLPLFQSAGFATALLDAPSDHGGEDGLGGFRSAPAHAEDLGNIIADVRARTQSAVWLIGTSRGTISAVNAAARLTGAAAPDGIVLTSALMSGHSGGQKAWVEQTVFSVPLEAIRQPLLVVGHAEDQCIRSPATLMHHITARTNGVREQVVRVTGGRGQPGSPSVNACEGRAPHGYVDQEEEVVAGIARFVRGGRY